MARPPQPKPQPQETNKGKSGIARLEKRLGDLTAFDPNTIQERWSPEVRALEAAIDESLAWVFGHNTVDYKRYEAAATLDNGPITMRSDFMGGTYRHDPHVVQGYLTTGKQNAIMLIRQAVRGLGEELEQEEPSSVKVASPKVQSRKVFIGHGRSLVWLQLERFLSERLHLTCDEFNAEAVAGISTTERLQTLLDDAGFAFLVMTAEDAHADSSTHARENVIHETGLFQGKLGFKRAIILLEESCAHFSNIHGLTYIGFPKGDLTLAFDEIRRVLERENLI
jgi:predicted nucleotide-binding protein